MCSIAQRESPKKNRSIRTSRVGTSLSVRISPFQALKEQFGSKREPRTSNPVLEAGTSNQPTQDLINLPEKNMDHQRP